MISGLIGSYQLDTPPGATITLIFIFMFILVNLKDSIKKSRKRKA
jgi:zinc transport system permease protein